PSIPSSNAANTIAASASSSLSSTESRIAVRPAQSASNVIRFGSKVRTGIALKRRRNGGGGGSNRGKTMPGKKTPNGGGATPRKRLSARLVNDLPAAKCPASVAGAKIGKDGFTRDRCLTNGHQRRRSLRQIDVQARAKTDHTKTLPGSDGLAGPYEADNP